MQALVLAGGEGTRLRPLTLTVPKPVMPLAGRPFLSFMLDWLRGHGVDEVLLSCGFLAHAVADVLGDEFEGMRLICGYMRAFGLSDDEIRQVSVINPRKIVGLD